MTHLSVRAATYDDLATLREIYRRASLSNEGDRAALLAAPDVLVWSGAGIADGLTSVAVDERGRILGFATLVEEELGPELEDLFVDPDHTRRGVATLLVEELVAGAVQRGNAWIEVTANPHAAAFYASVGFEVVGRAGTQFGDAPRLRRTTGALVGDDDDSQELA